MAEARTPTPGVTVRLWALLQQELARLGGRWLANTKGRLAARALRRRVSTRPGRSPAVPLMQLKARYRTLPVAEEKDCFVLYRIIGNDLPPRHRIGQGRANLAFILEHEPCFADCEKRWILNCIHDPDELAAMVALLEKHGQEYLCIPFDPEAYLRTAWDPSLLPGPQFLLSGMFERMLLPEERLRIEASIRRQKNLVAINNNGARNLAFADGRSRAKWILPFDGNCFFTEAAFAALRHAVTAAPWHPYQLVPMARVASNEELLAPGFRPVANEEPQLLFRRDALEQFDEHVPYGFRPKVELFWRLGVRGPWDRYPVHRYDQPRPCLSPDAGTVGRAGWVVRLSSGRPDLEIGDQAFKNRGQERNRAIIALLDRLDTQLLEERSADGPVFFDPQRIAALASAPRSAWAVALRQAADTALGQGPYSVVHKRGATPSGDPHDYFTAAPYYWPNPLTRSGRPSVRVDGRRAPGGVGCGLEADRYDRSRLQAFLNDTLVLALAHAAFGEPSYGAHARWLLRTWFLDPATRMHPHLRFAQVRFRDARDEGHCYGLIEFREVAYLLDAIRLLSSTGALGPEDEDGLRTWFQDYADWLEWSPQGRLECQQPNNHGVFYDVQLGAIAVFLRRHRQAALIRNRARLRLLGQVAPDGRMPRELARATPRHYVAFSLAGWSALARLTAHLGDDLWAVSDGRGRSLASAFLWLAQAERSPDWVRRERASFPVERLAPLWNDLSAHHPDPPLPRHWPGSDLPMLHADFGIPPFWMLQRV